MVTYSPFYGAPPALALAILFICAQTSSAEKPTYRSVVEEAFRNMKDGVNVTAILDSLQTGYDKRIRPNYGGEHVTVGVTMHILSISSVSEVQMDFTMDCYFRQHWRDPRLDFSQYARLDKLQVSTDYTNKIWVPDTFFPNEKRAYYHTATTPNEMLRIQPDGNVLRSIRRKAVAVMSSKVFEEERDFTLDFYFRQIWRDPRLAFPNQHGLKQLTVGSAYLQKIWVPDTFFANEKQSYFHMATTSNEMLRISQTGEVLRSMRLTITASCPMNLQYFPMDRQLCIIEIESFGYSMDHIRFSWHAGDKSIAIEQAVSLPQFRVLGYSRKDIVSSTSTGNYSRLLCEIMFVRSMGYYLIQIYIPSSLIVIISWVSFWLNRAATVARVSLGVTTVLTMTTLISSTNAALPKISYIKSIDVYLGTCFVMVFSSLIEYAAVGYLGKRIIIRKNRLMALQKVAEHRIATNLEISHPPPPPPPPEHQDHHNMKHPLRGKARSTQELSHPYKMKPDTEVRYKVHDPKAHSKGGTLENTINGRPDEEAPPKENKDLDKLCGCCPSAIDKYSRIVFPVCFICFNLMYWIIYLHISDDPAEDLILHNPS